MKRKSNKIEDWTHKCLLIISLDCSSVRRGRVSLIFLALLNEPCAFLVFCIIPLHSLPLFIPGGGGGGAEVSHIKRSRMLVVLLRSVSQGPWSYLVCSG